MNTYFGNVESDEIDGRTGQVAARIWGHRLRIGQTWMEYLLEFLNVVAGYDYQLGRGLRDQDGYKRFSRLGLRRFVFYDGTKSSHSDDDAALNRLMQGLPAIVDGSPDEPIRLTRQLLRAFTAVEKERSWYVKSLFPAHENLLFFEALRPGVSKLGRATDVLGAGQGLPSKEAYELDQDISYTARNFFCRGGEVYYLCLSAGTQGNSARSVRIMDRLKRLLRDRNREIGLLAGKVDMVWQELCGAQGIDQGGRQSLGYIPTAGHELYERMAEDVDALLAPDLDPLETLNLLAHLISFHIVLYIYYHSERALGNNVASPAQLPALLIDCLLGQSRPLRQASSELFGERHYAQQDAVNVLVEEQVREVVGRLRSADNVAEVIKLELPERLGLKLGPKRRSAFDQGIEKLAKRYSREKIDRKELLSNVSELAGGLLFADFAKNFAGIHRKLAKGIGFVLPREQGPNPRFVLGDTLLRALVTANVSSKMTFDDFLERLYERYGLVIATEQARHSGLDRRFRFDTGLYRHNQQALLLTMKKGGLVREYSDATAMVGA